MRTVTRTVVFTDLAGYTASVSRADREGLRDLIVKHEAYVTPIVERHGGRIVKNLGDSFMALFASATDALRAGIEIVDSALEQGMLNFRVSAATGDIEEIDGDAFGEAVNLSARINAKAPAGEVWFAGSTRICMNQAEIPWEPVGLFPMKGIAGEIPVYRAVCPSVCTIPSAIRDAIRANMLFRIRAGQPLPRSIPPNPVLLLEGFKVGSPQLQQVLASLPVLDPSSLWLSAYRIGPADRLAWKETGRSILIGTEQALDTAIRGVEQAVTRPAKGSETIILDMGVGSEVELVMAGLALPNVPLVGVVAGYNYDLLPDGSWVNRSPDAMLRIEVGTDRVNLVALESNISVDGRNVGMMQRVPLRHGRQIECPLGTFTYTQLDEHDFYVGMLLSDMGPRIGLFLDQELELGREPRHPGMALPDRATQENIRWCTGSRAARARSNGFTIDKALAGRRQAKLKVSGPSQFQLTTLHERLVTWFYQGQGRLTRLNYGSDQSLQINDLIVLGTSIIALRQPES